MSATTQYKTDFYSWTQEQAKLLQQHNFSEIDVQHLVEELFLMGARERRELMSRFRLLMMHLLKWRYQPAYRGRSWALTIKNQRDELAIHLRENPGLKSTLEGVITDAYRLARRDAEKESGLAEHLFPEQNPWRIEQLMDSEFFPE